MVDTLETFVERLQQDGVQAGQEAAEKIKADAQKQAEEVVAEAKKKAEKIIQDAQRQAEETKTRTRTDLQLAARDAKMRLQEALSDIMKGILAQAVKEPLKDPDFLKKIIHELTMKYAQADIEHRESIKLDMNPELHKQLAQFVIDEIHEAAQGHGVGIDLKNRLKQAGFEYSVSGGTVEITEESVAAILTGLVSPKLRELFDQAAGQQEK